MLIYTSISLDYRPPSIDESQLPNPLRPTYPHPFRVEPFIIGILASISIQAIRGPCAEGTSIIAAALIRLGRQGKMGVREQRGSGRWFGLLVSLL